MRKNIVSKGLEADIAGCRSTDKILCVGGDFSFMKKYVSELTQVEDIESLDHPDIRNMVFDRVLTDIDGIDFNAARKFASMSMETITIFDRDESYLEKLCQNFDAYWYPGAFSWLVKEEGSTCLVTTAHGLPYGGIEDARSS